MAFCYTIILGPAFTWIFAQGGTSIGVIPDAQKFFQGVIMLLIGFGIGFELPIVVFYLVIFNIVPYAKLRAQWRVVYVVLMLVASAATPDWSPLTMGGLYVALVLLYEGSMLFARVVLRKRIAAQKREEIELFGDDDADDDSATHPRLAENVRTPHARDGHHAKHPRRIVRRGARTPARRASPRSASASAS